MGNTLFSSVRDQIIKSLKSEHILETRGGYFAKPDELLYLPSEFVDDDGEYLLKHGPQQRHYLSSHYTLNELSILGVRPLTLAVFLSDLKSFASDQLFCFRQMPNIWHSKVATAALQNNCGLYRELKFCPLIPLQDGSWVSPSSGDIFFASTDTNVFVPGGIDVLLVDQASSQDPERRRLYQSLGVRTLGFQEVCKMILKTHDKASMEFTVKDLVSHASYMFRARELFRATLSDQLLLVTAERKCARGKDLYMELPNSVRLSDLTVCKDFVSLIHPLYLEQHEGSFENWTRWLHHDLQVAYLPRLFTQGSLINLTDEFHCLIQHAPTQCLLLLRDHWSHYFPPAHQDRRKREYAIDAVKRHLKISCSNGKLTAIGNTFFPKFI